MEVSSPGPSTSPHAMLYANTGRGPRQSLTSGHHPSSDAPWLDLVNPTDEERDSAERLTGLRVPTREDVAAIESSSRLFTERGALYVSMPFSHRDQEGRSRLTPVGMVLSDKHLLTIRFTDLPAFDTYAERFADAPDRNASEAFVGLAEAIVERVAEVLQGVAGQLDHLSKTTFGSEVVGHHQNARRADRRLRGILTSVGQCGDALGNLRDSMQALGRITAYAQQSRTMWVPDSLKDELVTLKADIASLNDYDQQLNQKVSFLLDAVLGFINIEQNNTFKVLTVVSVVGIPPTFVVGLYGMNFKMPEYNWAYGYSYAWVLIVISVVTPLVWFRIKGWI